MSGMVVDNWRNEKGGFENEWMVCSLCGCQTEVYMRYSIPTGASMILCKGCLNDAIKSIDNHYVAYMKDNKPL